MDFLKHIESRYRKKIDRYQFKRSIRKELKDNLCRNEFDRAPFMQNKIAKIKINEIYGDKIDSFINSNEKIEAHEIWDIMIMWKRNNWDFPTWECIENESLSYIEVKKIMFPLYQVWSDWSQEKRKIFFETGQSWFEMNRCIINDLNMIKNKLKEWYWDAIKKHSEDGETKALMYDRYKLFDTRYMYFLYSDLYFDYNSELKDLSKWKKAFNYRIGSNLYEYIPTTSSGLVDKFFANS